MTALPIAVAGDLPLEKRGEFRVASGAVIPNLGKIRMKSTDENGIERTLRGNITEVAKTAAKFCRGLQKMRLSSLRKWRNLVGTKHSCCFGSSSSFGQAQSLESSWQEHQALHREGRSWHRWSPLQAGPGCRLTMDNVTSRMNLRINLRSSGECWPLVSQQSWRGRNILKRTMLCSHLGARCVCVCESERNMCTASQTDGQGIGTIRTQKKLRFLLHV